MSTSYTPNSRETYHHGDLRTALLDVADRLLDEGGPEAVSLREAARRAGVSATAAYRHFADKESMQAALAVRGFDAFAAALAEAASNNSEEPLTAMGQAYVRFAVARPGRFRLMFGTSVAERERHPELLAAVERASVGFRSAVTSPASSDNRLAMLRAWSMIHGLAQLIIDGLLPGYDPEFLARAVTTEK
ncbi:TetR/AcrR family transcriptional regulator [Variovorax sp. ZS18.2.2]|uniref:TetR/AcrR family transcriptional regulator n=1 Tax=Variovorax sp. ZS18.2.2 TaxID=2971255 RepID=UPI00215113FE|nr:TetR/AcrR family transcriptional regulator [Variovorax sp. ZS18.2.2]MCR6480414.1 TetR/AcrR family transcriptional regulator [Variovorax sp. ZS18.2.2]